MVDPLEPQHAELMQTLAAFLDEQFNGPPPSPRTVGFVLLRFPFRESDDDDDSEGRVNYASNADLADTIKLMTDFLSHAQKRLEQDRRAKLQ
jgi:hypothetical protein